MKQRKGGRNKEREGTTGGGRGGEDEEEGMAGMWEWRTIGKETNGGKKAR